MRQGTRPRISPLVVLGATGAAVFLALLPPLFRTANSTAGHYALEGLVAGATAAVAILALSRYREAGDPQALLVAVGFAALTLQTVVFGLAVPIADATPWDGRATPSYAWQIGWLVAAACFAAARAAARRRDERVTENAIAAVAFTALAALDGLILLLRSSLPALSHAQLVGTDPSPFEPTTAINWILAVPALALLLLAAWEETRPPPEPRSPRPWLAAAYAVASGAQVLHLARPTQFRPIVQPADAFELLAVGLAFAGLVQAGRASVRDLSQVADEAREVTAARAELASKMSHEIKNPLMSIKGLASTGTRLYGSMSDEERLEFFHLIDDEAARLRKVVEDASVAMKVDAGSLTYDRRPEPLSEIVEEVVWAAPHDDHPLVVEVEPGIRAVCDRARTEDAILALVENAVKYSPSDAPIEVRARREDGRAVIEVSDHGPGIPAERRAAVFEKFAAYRPPGYEEVPGAGLGLFLARAHTVAQGGAIDVEDAADGGTMLRLTLPTEGAGVDRG